MKSARILLLADVPYMGGVTSHILSIAQAFREDAHFEFVLGSFPGRSGDDTLIETARAQGMDVHTFPMAWAFDARVLRPFRRFLEDKQIDLVHAHGYRATIICAFAAGRIPVITTFHGEAVAPTWRVRAWEWGRLRAARRHPITIACSDHVRRWLIARRFAPGAVRTIRNSVPKAAAAQGPSAPTRTSLGIPGDATVVLYIGRLAPGKGVETLLDLLAAEPGIIPVIVGDGPERRALESTEKSRQSGARFVGATSHTAPYYELADVVVLLSQMEALPMTLIEAAAHGKPVVATRVGGVPEVVRDGETGILVDHGDIPGIREALRRCTDRELRSSMGLRAEAVWRQHFSPQRMARELAETYGNILGV